MVVVGAVVGQLDIVKCWRRAEFRARIGYWCVGANTPNKRKGGLAREVKG